MADIICAIATAPATAALGIIRISGDGVLDLLLPMLKKKSGAPARLEHAKATLCRIEDQGEIFDEAMVTFFEGPRSFTGEDTAELCCHGGLYVLQSVMELLLRKGCRMAEPGEFSKRAFLNGKLDLIRAQAVIDLIEATSRAEQKNALSQLEGHLSRRITALYERLVELNTALLAYVDFPEEVDAPEEDTLQELRAIEEELSALLAGSNQGRLIKEGLQIAIVGAPNVGKSTLMNRLLGYDRSIVSSIPGTTRDTVTEGCRLGDLKCHIADTAGIRTTADPIEQQGIDIARRRAEEASVVFAVFDGSRPLSEEDQALAEEFGNGRNLAIINKADLPQMADTEYIQSKFIHCVKISAQNGAGCAVLDQWVREQFSPVDQTAEGMLTSLSQARRLLAGQQAVRRAIEGLEAGFTPDLASLDITEAASAVGEVTGDTVTEKMIDNIFSKFCVGK
ncbi:MAG: tRNA uridine-5-carboxymethylaminomethyl(34) synthesis GTPase MnmE [Clostridia bacterium]|nr:tRNA uridine-5-carboxymethylaminomethyl(34) synthesis GTPase MnmE [Clostridia bacterium]